MVSIIQSRRTPLSPSIFDHRRGELMNPIQVLHVDASASFGDLVAKILEREDERIEVINESTPVAGLEQLDTRDIDCVVSEYEMTDMSGLEFLERIRANNPDIPFILFTGKGSEEVASEAFSKGATDYLQKRGGTNQYTLLANRISNYVESARAEKRRRRQLEAIETAQEGISLLDEDGYFIYVNGEYADIYGYNPEEMIGEHWELTYPEHEISAVYEEILPEVREKGEWHGETKGRRADGSTFPEDHSLSMSGTGELICTVREVSEQGPELAEARYESIAESATDAIITIDADSTIRFANPAVEDIFGYAPSDIVGEPLTVLMPERFRTPHREAVSRFIETGERQIDWTEVELTGQRKDGESVPLSISFSSFDYRGDTHFTGIIREITDRKEREHELERERERFATFFESLPNPALSAVSKGGEPIVQNVNPAFEDTFGINIDDISGEPLHDHILPDGNEDKARDLSRRILREGGISTEVTRSTADGPRTFHLNVEVLNPDADSPVGYAVYTDITDRKEREQALKQRNRRLDDFASIVAHDLQTPLATAIGYLELLQDEHHSAAVREIEDALSRAETILDDTLTLARDGKVIDDVDTLALESLAADSWRNVPTKSATLEVDADSKIRADTDRLHRVFENLFRNAVEHGGEGVTVRIGEFDGGYYVEDDGPGIPSEKRRKVFEPGHTESSDGTGFGLAIVQGIAEAHGWEVSITEGSEGGARFEFSGVSLL